VSETEKGEKERFPFLERLRGGMKKKIFIMRGGPFSGVGLMAGGGVQGPTNSSKRKKHIHKP